MRCAQNAMLKSDKSDKAGWLHIKRVSTLDGVLMTCNRKIKICYELLGRNIACANVAIAHEY
jgi:hypothetical protein